MAKQISFTPAALDAAICVRIHDPATAGLILETLPSGRKRWQFRRRIHGSTTTVKMNLGPFPVHSIADARAWAAGLNEHVEAGRDPREVLRQEEDRATMTVARAHELYMTAVGEGRASRAKRLNKPRTVSDKQEMFDRDIAPKLGRRNIYEVTEAELVRLVTAKGKTARIRANRLAAELKVFFSWTASLRGMEVGLEVNPSRRLGDLRFPESPRSRSLSHEEIGWFLQAVAEEERKFQRGCSCGFSPPRVWRKSLRRVATNSAARSGCCPRRGRRTASSIAYRSALGGGH
jgi:hypothetical protein